MKRIGYLVADSRHLSEEELAGWMFLKKQRRFHCRRVSLRQLIKTPTSLRQLSILWWHFDSSIELPPAVRDPSVVSSIREFVDRGGSLFLTLLAAQCVVDLGFEEVRQNILEKGKWNRTCWAEKYPDIRGLSSFRGHPIFSGLYGAVYTWSPTADRDFAAAFYEAPALPKNGHVVAVEREYIKLDEDWRVAVEYKFGKGRVLTVGSFMFFADQQNRFRPHLELFSSNCLEYLGSSPNRTSRSYWTFSPRTVRWTQRHSRPPVTHPVEWRPDSSGLSLLRDKATNNSFDVGGRRILIMGTEDKGIEEVWAHPVRIVKDVKIGFRIGNREAEWAERLQPKINVRPESITRTFVLHGMEIEETTFSDLKYPAGVLHFKTHGNHPIEIMLTATIDLRIMWPLSDQATGSLTYGWDDGLQAVVVHAESANATSVIGGSQQPAEYALGRYSEIEDRMGRFAGTPAGGVQVAIGLRYVLAPGEFGCTIAFAGSSVSESEAIRAYRRICTHPLRSLNEQARHFKSLLSRSPNVHTSDPTLDESYRWAVAATDRFFVETPGLGTSLMAGYATSQSGWDGGHILSGRPGYAWYFGRDSVWTALAMLAYGDFAKVRSVLEFLGNYQDITGKIAHEITTSGHVHYDAADATPLYILLMGRYLRARGDRGFVRHEFPRLLKAINFCFSTDTDGDHLIENTNIGHGWIEGGPLFPAHAELYLNACWCASLEEAAYIAEKLKRNKEQHAWRREAKHVRRIINEEFWNESTGLYSFAKNGDGTFNTQQTILSTVGAYLGVTDHEKTARSLRAFASERFSTDWGVRLIASDNPLYTPSGYHCGSVWPLFTGWTALAELRHGLREPGLRHLTSNLMLFRKFSLGCIPEVLHGDQCKPAGVCNHQAWSEALTVLGILEAYRGQKETLSAGGSALL